MSRNLPDNVKHLVGYGDLQLMVPPDGACAANAGACHIFHDAKYGPQFRMVMNNHMADRWHFYKNKVNFPYERQVGVSGKFVRFEVSEEEKFCKFLKTKESAFLWSDSEDIQLMANLYQMNIRIITTKGAADQSPTVNFIGPDPDLNAYKMIPEGVVPEMTLLHYDEQHYNLVISQDSDLANFGSLSERISEDEGRKNEEDTSSETEDISSETEDISFKENDINESTVNELKAITHKYRESQKTIENLRRKIKCLEEELKKKPQKNDEAFEDRDHYEEISILNNKKNGFVRENPHVEPCRKQTQKEFKCNVCNFTLESQGLLNSHIFNHNEQELKFPCEVCDKRYRTNNQLKQHVKTEHEPVLEFNCEDCSYQGDSALDLRKHLEVTHHNSSVEKEITFSCHSCGLSCTSKWNLMNHRKEYHSELLRKCRYFLNGSCAYEDSVCWYKHKSLVEDTASAESRSNFKCSFCDNVFQRKEELLTHRKETHVQSSMFKCREFKQGTCKFSANECWYKHDNKIAEDKQDDARQKHFHQNSDFQNVQDNPHPPEMMERIISMMERLANKVESLEQIVKNDQ